MPSPISLDNEAEHPDIFVAERARNNLLILAANGSRVVGSFENEVGAVNFLLSELKNITQNITSNRKVVIDVQSVNGSYYLDFKPFGAYNVYHDVQNVIAKIYATNISKYSILINAHFDSVPTSPGGSDDGIMCTVMLEVIRQLCQWNGNLQYNLIFLFNGAEESPLQAAHGFITQHKWAKEVKVVINLEAAGSGSKEILFQSGPGHSWLLNYYAKIPHPYGQVAGEEIFQSNIIPSDTDFRIFRDYGNIVGFDLAFFKNGYKYHTNFDDVESIPLASYQHVGDNVLELVKKIANAPEIEYMKSSHTKAVYFDVFGLFMVWYQDYIGTIINLVVTLLSCLVAYKSFLDFKLGRNWKSKIYLIVTALVLFFSWVFTVIGIIGIGTLIDGLNYSMSWYGSPYLIFGLYVVPTVMLSSVPLIGWNYFNKKLHFSTRVQSQLQYSIVRLIWTVVLLIATCLNIRSAYALMIPVLFNAVGSVFIHLTKLHHSANGWKIAYMLFNAFPSMMIMYQSVTILSLFIPITGRIGSDKNPDVIIGVVSMALTILFSSFYTHFLAMMKKPFWLIYFFLVIFLIHFLIIVTPLGFPYSGNPTSPAPQRFMIYHTKRTFNNQNGLVKQDAGYFLVNLDRHSPESVIPYVKQFEKRISIKDDCENFLVCGLPLFSPRMLAVMESSTWIPAEEPIIKEDIALHLNSKTYLKRNVLTYNFTAAGPDHFNIYFSPKTNIRLVNNSFDALIPKNVPVWNGRLLYFANFVWGVSKSPLEFSIDLEVPENWNTTVMDIGISGKYIHEKKNQHTPQFQAFLSDFPKWANIVPAIANFESWEI
ncbi:hypothetical protein Trydic_g5407 [Trypoxylus dichotomus]